MRDKLLSALTPFLSIGMGWAIIVAQTIILTEPGPERLLVYAGLFMIVAGFSHASSVRKQYE